MSNLITISFTTRLGSYQSREVVLAALSTTLAVLARNGATIHSLESSINLPTAQVAVTQTIAKRFGLKLVLEASI